MSSRNWNDRFRASLRGHLTRMRSFSAWNRSEKSQDRSQDETMAEGPSVPPRDPPHPGPAQEELARGNEPKRKRFRALRAVSRIFRRKSTKRSGASPSKDEHGQGRSMKSRSTSELLVRNCPDDRESDLSAYSSGLSLSHDSIFAPESDDGLDLGDQRRMDGYAGGVRAYAPGLQEELLNKMRERQDSDVDDAGLPHSPCTSPTTADVLLHDWGSKPGKLRSSDGSLMSMGSSETDNEDGATGFGSSRLFFDPRRPNIDPDLDVGVTTLLNNRAAHHKIAIRPKRRHAVLQHRCLNQVATGRSLPTTPEDVEESSPALHPSPLPRSTIPDKKPTSATSAAPRKSRSDAPVATSGSQGLPVGKDPLLLPTGPSSSKSHAAERKLRHEIHRYGQRHLERDPQATDPNIVPPLSPEAGAPLNAEDLSTSEERTTSCFNIAMPGSRREKKARLATSDESSKRSGPPKEAPAPEATPTDPRDRVAAEDSNRVVIPVPSDSPVPPATESISTNVTVVVRPRSVLSHRLSGRIARISQHFEDSAAFGAESEATTVVTATQQRPHSSDAVGSNLDPTGDHTASETSAVDDDRASPSNEPMVRAPVPSPRHAVRKVKPAKPPSPEGATSPPASVATKLTAPSCERKAVKAPANSHSAAPSESIQALSPTSDLKTKTPVEDATVSAPKPIKVAAGSEASVEGSTGSLGVEGKELNGASRRAWARAHDDEHIVSLDAAAVPSCTTKQNSVDMTSPQVLAEPRSRVLKLPLEDVNGASASRVTSPISVDVAPNERKRGRTSKPPQLESATALPAISVSLERTELVKTSNRGLVQPSVRSLPSPPGDVKEQNSVNATTLQAQARSREVNGELSTKQSVILMPASNLPTSQLGFRGQDRQTERKMKSSSLQGAIVDSKTKAQVVSQTQSRAASSKALLPEGATETPKKSVMTSAQAGQPRKLKEAATADGSVAAKRKGVLEQLSNEDIIELDRESEGTAKVALRVSVTSPRDSRAPVVRPLVARTPMEASPPKSEVFGEIRDVLIVEEQLKPRTSLPSSAEPRSPLAPLDIQPYVSPVKTNNSAPKTRPNSVPGVVRMDVEWESPHGVGVPSTAKLPALPDRVEIQPTAPKVIAIKDGAPVKVAADSSEQSELFQVFRRRSLRRTDVDTKLEQEVADAMASEDAVKGKEAESPKLKSVKAEAKIVFEAVSPRVQRHHQATTNKTNDKSKANSSDPNVTDKRSVASGASKAVVQRGVKSVKPNDAGVETAVEKITTSYGQRSPTSTEKSVASQIRSSAVTLGDPKSRTGDSQASNSKVDSMEPKTVEQRSGTYGDARLLPSKKRSVTASDAVVTTPDRLTSPTSGGWKSWASDVRPVTVIDSGLANHSDPSYVTSKYSPLSSIKSSRSRSSSSSELESTSVKTTGQRPLSSAVKETGYRFGHNSVVENGDVVKPGARPHLTYQKDETMADMRRRPSDRSNIVILGNDATKETVGPKEISNPKELYVQRGSNVSKVAKVGSSVQDHPTTQTNSTELPSPSHADGSHVHFWKDVSLASARKSFHGELVEKQKTADGVATRPTSTIVIDDLVAMPTSATITAYGGQKKSEGLRPRSVSTPIGPQMRTDSGAPETVVESAEESNAPSWMKLAQQRRDLRKQQLQDVSVSEKTDPLTAENQTRASSNHAQSLQTTAKTLTSSYQRTNSSTEILDKANVEDRAPQWRKAMQQRQQVVASGPASALGTDSMIIQTKPPDLTSSPPSQVATPPPPAAITIPASVASNRSSKVLDMVSSYQKLQVS